MEDGEEKDKMTRFAIIMMTTSILPLLITTPLGAILSATCLNKLLPIKKVVPLPEET